MTSEALSEAQSRWSQQEWETRVALAALYRLLDRYGMTDVANQEIGARVKGDPDHFLIHPYGFLYEEVRASDLVKVNLEGEVVEAGVSVWTGSGSGKLLSDGSQSWVSDGGINLGKWIFGARDDVNFFIHGHCEDVMVVSATENGLLPVSQAAVYLLHRIAYIDYEFLEDEEYGRQFTRTLGEKDILISHNHGYYALGRTPAEAFFRAYFLRQACAAQVKAAATGDKLRAIDMQRVAMLQDQMEASEHYNYDGTTEWAALLRKLERDCPDYKS